MASSDFGLEETIGISFWSIHVVPIAGGVYRVDLLNGLLDNGTSKTQDEHITYSIENQNKTGFGIGSLLTTYSASEVMFDNKDTPKYREKVEQVRAFLQAQFEEGFLLDNTRIRNMPAGEKDVVIHNYRLPNQQEIKADIVGPDEWIKGAKDIETYAALLGTGDVEKINRVFEWLVGQDGYLWRVNSKPTRSYETVARFDAYSDRAGPVCCRDPAYSYSSLGVRLVAEGDAPEK